MLTRFVEDLAQIGKFLVMVNVLAFGCEVAHSGLEFVHAGSPCVFLHYFNQNPLMLGFGHSLVQWGLRVFEI